VVATPIGNLADVTQRAVDTLRSVDTVFAEDTRHAAVLLAHHAIRAPLAALHEHNEREAARAVCRLLAAGKDVALVSDAGTPAISDPGAIAVAAARAAGFAVVPIPGASAAVAALSVAGMPGPYAFVGFLPAKSAARRNALGTWRAFPHTLVFYEAPHRIVDCVEDIAAVLGGERAVVLARELTKVFETAPAVSRGAAAEADQDRQRGEFVVLVSARRQASAAARGGGRARAASPPRGAAGEERRAACGRDHGGAEERFVREGARNSSAATEITEDTEEKQVRRNTVLIFSVYCVSTLCSLWPLFLQWTR
jgi:16S rRNA (cytidine1402-2'-O)-methyltransferase